MGESVVYFCGREKMVKIGVTTQLKTRLSALSRGGNMPPGMTVGPVTLLATLPGDRKLEKELHEEFAATRVHRTEWFRESPPLLDFIQVYAVGAPEPPSAHVTLVDLYRDRPLSVSQARRIVSIFARSVPSSERRAGPPKWVLKRDKASGAWLVFTPGRGTPAWAYTSFEEARERIVEQQSWVSRQGITTRRDDTP